MVNKAGLILAVLLTSGSAQAAQPVVVELFTSQGCSSCPPANANLAAVSDRPDVLALSFGVTYWDYLGWKDTFAQPQFTQRQIAYERGLGHSGPFTPQIVVNGRADTVGNVRGEVERLIAGGRLDGPAISLAGGTVRVASSAAPLEPLDVWLVRYDPRVIQVPVARGENGGATLPHKNVVRELTRLGVWRGNEIQFAVAPAPAGLLTAVLVQKPDGGPIVAAFKP
ncbi:MAG: DUF1223 domain-containing protein [Proteobacteria bacterium]|nr:DUF1223 domain-containing protein [Pseudomonadota bacterium]